METKFVYWDDIYTDGKGKYCTEQYLINKFYCDVEEKGNDKVYVSKYDDKDIYTKVKDTWKELQGKTVRCNYAQIFHDNDSLLLCNNIVEADECLYENVEGGELYDYYDADGNEITYDEYEELGWENNAREEPRDIYQYYLINDSLARMLIEHTDNIIFYSDKLDLYVLGVTHFGTGWSCVAEDFIW